MLHISADENAGIYKREDNLIMEYDGAGRRKVRFLLSNIEEFLILGNRVELTEQTVTLSDGGMFRVIRPKNATVF